MVRCRSLYDIHPTQLYISSEKLARVLEELDFDNPNYEPLPVFKHEDDWYFSDGHTRAFAAALAGEKMIRIERDERVRDEFDFDVYLTCIEWCATVGVETIHDLIGRVVEPDTYEKCWIARCQRLGD